MTKGDITVFLLLMVSGCLVSISAVQEMFLKFRPEVEKTYSYSYTTNLNKRIILSDVSKALCSVTYSFTDDLPFVDDYTGEEPPALRMKFWHAMRLSLISVF